MKKIYSQVKKFARRHRKCQVTIAGRQLSLLLCVVLAFAPLLGCRNAALGNMFRFDISSPVTSLDPQFVTDPHAAMIVANLFEGLVIRGVDGEILPGAAERWDISDDRLRYTFHLREGLVWSNGYDLTADDFVFAFHRIFNDRAPSPYAVNYLNIRNAEGVLSGALPVASLGVAARDRHTVVFTLHTADPFFLTSLTEIAAMPCNRAFFENTRGRYALERRLLITNGPFSLRAWDNTRHIIIERSISYTHTPVEVAGVHFYIGRENPVALFLSGRSDVIAAPFSQMQAISNRATIVEYQKTTWAIVFNQNDPVLGNPMVRQGFSYALDRGMYADELSENFTATDMFVPPAMMFFDRPFREFADAASPLPHDPQRGEHLFRMGLRALEIESLPHTTLLIPDTASQGLYVGLAGQSWQRYLGVFLNIQPSPPQEIERRIATGDYQMALMPFSPGSNRVSSLLSVFHSNARQNHFAYSSGFFDHLLYEAAKKDTLYDAVDRYRRAENLLLMDAVVIPVYFETTYFAVANGISGLIIEPFTNIIHFRNGEKI